MRYSSGRSGWAKQVPPLITPALLLLAATALFRLTEADLAVSRYFYNEQEGVWPLVYARPCLALYHYGVYPALVVGIGGLIVGLVLRMLPRGRAYSRPGLFLGAMLLLGPGMLVNLALKENWGRPRPDQTAHFGGDKEFLPVGDVGDHPDAKSFPCGHASMGFYLMAPAFLLYRRRPVLAAGFLLLGLAGGLTMGLARIVQGRHFASDVLWAGGLVYMTGLVLYVVFRLGDTPPDARETTPASASTEWPSAVPEGAVEAAGAERASAASEREGPSERHRAA